MEPQTIGFTGHVNDADTGLVYMQQRYYDPMAGRFLSLDQVLTDAETGKSFNRYVYANNNPYKFVDPDGRYACNGNTSECAKVDAYVAAIKTSAESNKLSGSERKDVGEIASYIGEKGKGGPTITVAPLGGNTQANTDQKGNITIDVNKTEKLSNPIAKGAAALGHEARHDVDASKKGPVSAESGREAVLARERSAYGTQGAIAKGLGLTYGPQSLEKAAQESTNHQMEP